MAIEIKRIINEPIHSNCYVIYDATKPNGCIIVDPGSQNEKKLYDTLKASTLRPEYIILTHEHYDHCWGVNQIRERWSSVKLVCSAKCSTAIQSGRGNYSHYSGFHEFMIEPAELILEDIGWNIEWNGYKLLFEPAKGHTESGIIFKIGNALFTGDTLIKNEETVTKFKTGSSVELEETLHNLEQIKGNGFVVYPGHGEIFSLDSYDLSFSMNI